MLWVKMLWKRTVYNKLNIKVNSVQNKIPVVTTFIHINQDNTGKQNFEKKTEDVDNKKLEVSGLVTVLDTNIGTFQNKKKTNTSG